MEILMPKGRRRSLRLMANNGGPEWRQVQIELVQGAYNNRGDFIDMLQFKIDEALPLAGINGKR